MKLIAENVARRYFRQTREKNYFYAVKDVSLTLEPGTLTEITGRSGSGKSTLLNMLAGLLEPTEGKVLLDDADLYQMEDAQRSKRRNRSLGIIPQGQTGLHALTVLENVLLPWTMYEKGAAPTERALALLEQVDILNLKDAYPNELSGGEMRRLAIARAQIMNPEIILADEPTGDLDDENTAAVLQLLRDLADQGKAVLLVTHEKEAAAYADVVYRMRDGELTIET